MAEVSTAARTMDDVKAWAICQESEVVFGQLVEMHNNPALIDRLLIEKVSKRGLADMAIVHRAPEAMQQIEEIAATVTKHLHLLLRLGEMNRKQHFAFVRSSRRRPQ